MAEDIRLHIGRLERREGWSMLDVNPGPHVDYVGNCEDLSSLADQSCSEVYAPHVLERLGYNGEIQGVPKGIRRILKYHGRLRSSGGSKNFENSTMRAACTLAEF